MMPTMGRLILSFLLWAGPSDGPARLRAAFPGMLPDEPAAAEQYWAAAVAGAEYGVDPDILLGIASHESQFHPRTVTREPGHRVSCGVMTPTPQRRCSRYELTALGGYEAGARHLRTWLRACRGDRWCALTAYAGGMVTVRMCRRGRRVRSPAGRPVCGIAREFIIRALRAGKEIE